MSSIGSSPAITLNDYNEVEKICQLVRHNLFQITAQQHIKDFIERNTKNGNLNHNLLMQHLGNRVVNALTNRISNGAALASQVYLLPHIQAIAKKIEAVCPKYLMEPHDEAEYVYV